MKHPNNTVLLKSGVVAVIYKFNSSDNSTISYMEVKKYAVKKSIFKNPCDSNELNICEVDKISDNIHTIPLTSQKKKPKDYLSCLYNIRRAWNCTNLEELSNNYIPTQHERFPMKVSKKVPTKASHKLLVSYLKLSKILLRNIPRNLPGILMEDKNDWLHLSFIWIWHVILKEDFITLPLKDCIKYFLNLSWNNLVGHPESYWKYNNEYSWKVHATLLKTF